VCVCVFCYHACLATYCHAEHGLDRSTLLILATKAY
jgi:hypothetical protein